MSQSSPGDQTEASPPPAHRTKTARQNAMALYAHAKPEDLARLIDTLPARPAHEIIRAPETGLVMTRARMGGTGSPFNLGEVTVTRCVVRLESGEIGSAYVLGRDKTHARNAAVCDALWQNPTHEEDIRTRILTPLCDARDASRQRIREETAATKVDFFTMVRGDN